MTSKISYFKFIKADIRQRGWLAALSAVLFFLLMPVYTLLTLDGMKATAASNGGNSSFLDMASNAFPRMFNGTSLPLAITIALLGLVCAATGFSYLHSKEKQDFYQSMPLGRFRWFTVSYVSGLLMFLVPYLVFGGCTLLIGQLNGLMDPKLFIACLTAMLGGLLGFLICYHTALFAMFLTGQLVTGILASLVLFVYGSILTALYGGLVGSFFKTWSHSSPNKLSYVLNYSSPASLYVCINTGTTYRGLGSTTIVCTLLCIVFLLACSLILCRYYPAEAAEHAIAFPKSAPVIKILIAMPTALFAGLLADSLNSNTENLWIIFISILTVVLLCLMIEFIYHRDLRQILSGKISTAVSVGGVLIILFLLQFDVFGYDSYLPKENNITNMSIYCDSFSNYFSYPESYQSINYDQLTAPGAAIKNYAPLYQLAKTGVENEKQGITPSAIDQGKHRDAENITLRFGLSKKRSVYRKYAVDRTKLLDAMRQLCKSETYRKELFPVFHLDRKEILQISAQDIYYHLSKLSLSREQQNQLLDAYEKDVLNVDISTLANDAPLGELWVELPDRNTSGTDDSSAISDASDKSSDSGNATIMLGRLYVYSSYRNTLNLLNQFGYTFRTKIDPEDVLLMTYYPNEDIGETPTANHARPNENDFTSGSGVNITKPDKMEKLLSEITYGEGGGLLGMDKSVQGGVEITFRGDSSVNGYPLHDSTETSP